jgi:hypothetical protein
MHRRLRVLRRRPATALPTPCLKFPRISALRVCGLVVCSFSYVRTSFHEFDGKKRRLKILVQ